MFRNNWDTRTALTCRLPEIMKDACEGCRDRRFCDSHKQMTIDEWLMMKGVMKNDNNV